MSLDCTLPVATGHLPSTSAESHERPVLQTRDVAGQDEREQETKEDGGRGGTVSGPALCSSSSSRLAARPTRRRLSSCPASSFLPSRACRVSA